MQHRQSVRHLHADNPFVTYTRVCFRGSDGLHLKTAQHLRSGLVSHLLMRPFYLSFILTQHKAPSRILSSTGAGLLRIAIIRLSRSTNTTKQSLPPAASSHAPWFIFGGGRRQSSELAQHLSSWGRLVSHIPGDLPCLITRLTHMLRQPSRSRDTWRGPAHSPLPNEDRSTTLHSRGWARLMYVVSSIFSCFEQSLIDLSTGVRTRSNFGVSTQHTITHVKETKTNSILS